MYEYQGDKPCWEVGGTLCNHPGIRIARDRLAHEQQSKPEACARSGCIYYRAMKGKNFDGRGPR
jgi:hypothetical protein